MFLPLLLLLLLSVCLVFLLLILLLHLPLFLLTVLAQHGFRNCLGFDASRALANALSSVFWPARVLCRAALDEIIAGGAVGVDEVFDAHLGSWLVGGDVW